MNAFRKHALDIAAFIWGVAEGTLFFFVPDVLLSYIGLTRGVSGGFETQRGDRAHFGLKLDLPKLAQ